MELCFYINVNVYKVSRFKDFQKKTQKTHKKNIYKSPSGTVFLITKSKHCENVFLMLRIRYSITEFKKKIFPLSFKVFSPYKNKWYNATILPCNLDLVNPENYGEIYVQASSLS